MPVRGQPPSSRAPASFVHWRIWWETLNHADAPLSAVADRVFAAVRFLRATGPPSRPWRVARAQPPYAANPTGDEDLLTRRGRGAGTATRRQPALSGDPRPPRPLLPSRWVHRRRVAAGLGVRRYRQPARSLPGRGSGRRGHGVGSDVPVTGAATPLPGHVMGVRGEHGHVEATTATDALRREPRRRPTQPASLVSWHRCCVGADDRAHRHGGALETSARWSAREDRTEVPSYDSAGGYQAKQHRRGDRLARHQADENQQLRGSGLERRAPTEQDSDEGAREGYHSYGSRLVEAGVSASRAEGCTTRNAASLCLRPSASPASYAPN